MNTIELFETTLRSGLAQHTRSGIMDKIAAYHADIGDLDTVDDVEEELLESRLAKTAAAIHARLTGNALKDGRSVLERLRG